jgi:selenide,water dikinase
MGGTALTAMTLAMFPSRGIPLETLGDIFRGGAQKVSEAGALIVGGHTINDSPPKYGLSVTGVVHPDRIITNCAARQGDALVLCKPIGTGIILAGRRIGEASEEQYRGAIDTMKTLNAAGSRLMQSMNVRCATDVTGFGLLGHARKMAAGSGVSLRIESSSVPALPGAAELAELGCLPGAAFRNLEFIEQGCVFSGQVGYGRKMLLCDAQTSGGLLMCVAPEKADSMVGKLQEAGYGRAAIIGGVAAKSNYDVFIN